MMNRLMEISYKISIRIYSFCRYFKEYFTSFYLKIIGLIFSIIILLILVVPERLSVLYEILILIEVLIIVFYFITSVSFYLYERINLFEDEIRLFFLSKEINIENIEFENRDDDNPFIQSGGDFSLTPILKLGGLIYIKSTIYRKGFIHSKNNSIIRVWIKIDFKFNKISKISFIVKDIPVM